MRILHISTRLILGGSQENTVLSCEGQAALGHDVHLAFGPIYGPEGSMLERVENFRVTGGDAGITTHVVGNMYREIKPIADARSYGEIRRLVERIRPDVVHTHSSKAGIVGRAAAWSVHRKSADRLPAVIHTIHGPPFHTYQSNRKNKVYEVAERFAAKRCHLIVSVCDAMTSQYLDRGIGQPSQYVTVYSGMETEAFLDPPPDQTRSVVRQQLGIDDSCFVIGTVARLAELKGHDDLLDALGPLLHEHPNWRLLWVGDGWWADRLLSRVNEMGLSDQVITTGLVPPERVPGYVHAMDVLAHPSYREGLPRTVPQALLSGVVPIAYDVDGTGEACRSDETGVLVRPGDLDGLRDGVRMLHDDPALRQRLAECGRAECRDRFSAATMVRHLEGVYERAITLAQGG